MFMEEVALFAETGSWILSGNFPGVGIAEPSQP